MEKTIFAVLEPIIEQNNFEFWTTLRNKDSNKKLLQEYKDIRHEILNNLIKNNEKNKELTKSLKKESTKEPDIIIKTNHKIYVIETNFYASSGSKLDTTAKNYELIAGEFLNKKNIELIWITDGKGWKTKNHFKNLKEFYFVSKNLYTLKMVNTEKFKNIFI